MKEGIDHDMGAKHARWFVISAKTTGWLRETELVPKTQGIVSAIKETKFALKLLRHGKVPIPIPPHVADRIHEARGLYDIVRNEGRPGALGIVQSERALAKIDQEHPEGSRRGLGPRPGRHHPGQAADGRKGRGRVKVAYYKGCLAALSAKELDTSTKALAPRLGLELEELDSVTCCGAGDIHEAEPDYYLHLNARILAYGEATGADTLMTVCNVCTLNLRQANVALQKDDELRERVNANLEAVGLRTPAASRSSTSCG